MKNVPEKIYLQIGGPAPDPGADFTEISQDGVVSWCGVRVFESDLKFLSAENTCRNCAHFSLDEGDGVCRNIHSPVSSTSPDFGCNKFEGK